MSPKVADPAQRVALIEAAARLIAEHGSDALSLRRLAGEVGTSTMAIYTHFGGMDEVRRAVRREGFTRLAEHLSSFEESGDAVADLTLMGAGYFTNAVTNPHLYRVMFMDLPFDDDPEAGVGIDTFLQLVQAVERCIQAGRFDDADSTQLATQIWALSHGVVALHLAGFLTGDDAVQSFRDGAQNLFRAFGDDPGALGRSTAAALRRLGLL